MALLLQVALQQPLFLANTQFSKFKPSTKALPDFFTPFAPQLFQVATAHPFLTAHGNSAVPALPHQTSFNFMSKTSVKAACGSDLVQWIASCLQNIGRPRPINILADSAGIPRVLLQHHGNLTDIRVDFAFIYGHTIEEERVATILQAKAVGSLKPAFWRGIRAGDPADLRMAQEARAYAYLFNTSLVLFFDGKTLVRLHFTGNPLDTNPRVWVVEHGQEDSDSVRRVVLHAICQGLDMKQPGWI